MSSGPLRIEAETAVGVFQLARGDAEIEQRAADLRDPKFVEDATGLAKVGLPQGDAVAEVRQASGRERERVRILIEREDIGARSQNRFGMAATAAGTIENERTRARREQFDRFRREHRAVIGEVFHILRLLIDEQRTGREPDRPFE